MTEGRGAVLEDVVPPPPTKELLLLMELTLVVLEIVSPPPPDPAAIVLLLLLLVMPEAPSAGRETSSPFGAASVFDARCAAAFVVEAFETVIGLLEGKVR